MIGLGQLNPAYPKKKKKLDPVWALDPVGPIPFILPFCFDIGPKEPFLDIRKFQKNSWTFFNLFVALMHILKIFHCIINL